LPVQVVTESETEDLAGNVTPVYEITFTVADRPGIFTVQVPKTGDPVADAAAQLDAVKAAVAGIYALPV
jgi:hypothetical protein